MKFGKYILLVMTLLCCCLLEEEVCGLILTYAKGLQLRDFKYIFEETGKMGKWENILFSNKVIVFFLQ
jgi:hypothetical protein